MMPGLIIIGYSSKTKQNKTQTKKYRESPTSKTKAKF